MLQEYKGLAPDRAYLSSLAAALYEADVPLSSVQRDHLLQIAATSKAKGNSGSAPGEVDWSQVISDSGRILSPEQIELLELAQRQRETSAEVNKLASELLAKSRSGGG